MTWSDFTLIPFRDRLVPLDLRVIPDPSAPRAPQDYPEPQDWKASKVLKESREPPALRDPLELTAFRSVTEALFNNAYGNEYCVTHYGMISIRGGQYSWDTQLYWVVGT